MFHTASGKAAYPTCSCEACPVRPRRRCRLRRKGLRFHDLRHTRATLLIAAGAHAKRVQERLGHSSIITTLNLYGHVLRCTEAALVDALDAIYEQCDAGKLNEHVGSSSFDAWLSSEAQAKAAGYATRSPVASSRRAPKSAAQRAPWSSGSRTVAVARSSRPHPYGGNPNRELGGVERRARERAKHGPRNGSGTPGTGPRFDVKAGVFETVELTPPLDEVRACRPRERLHARFRQAKRRRGVLRTRRLDVVASASVAHHGRFRGGGKLWRASGRTRAECCFRWRAVV